MHWIAPFEKDAASTSLERRLRDATDQFWVNSGLKDQEYAGHIVGLIFLRFAAHRQKLKTAELERMGGKQDLKDTRFVIQHTAELAL
jgi:type I restriction enzyme M protein